MSELSSQGDSYDSLLIDLRTAINDARREWSASLLCAFPERQLLKSVAQEACSELGTLGVEVNALLNGQQVTLAMAPGGGVEVSVPDSDSLCVLTVGLSKPLKLSDADDGFTDGHVLHERDLGSWASVPLVVQDEAAGTVCAVNGDPRKWSDADQEVLQRASDRISRAIEKWLEEN